MSPFVFDTLSASKQLREAGMPEGVAEAVVSVFQHAATMPDISHLATKADLEGLSVATKADLEAVRVAIKADLEAVRAGTKADLEAMRAATKADLDLMKADIGTLGRDMATKADIADLKAEFHKEVRQQGWMLMGGVGVLVTILNVTLKMLG